MTLPRWPGWRHLPRDTRDVLFVLGVIGWTVLPHLSHLPWWCGALTAVVLAWRAQLALAGAALPGRWWVLAVLAVAVVLTLTTHRTLLGKEAGVTLLVMLMVLKTLELRARRDALVVFFLGFFLVLTNFLYSQSLPVAAAMIVSVWGLLTALVLAHMPVGQPSLRTAGGLAARAALLGAPLMLVLWLLFPRFAPLWGMPSDAVFRTGLSNTLQFGSIAEIALDDTIAMRLRFDGPVPPPQELYFRGPVLTHFDGRDWRRLDAPPADGPAVRQGLSARLRLIGEPVRYQVTLEPVRQPVLPLLEASPASGPAAPRIEGWPLQQRDDLQWATQQPVTERLRFAATAWPRFEHGPLEPQAALRDALQLPPGYNPGTLRWAATLRDRLGGSAVSSTALAGAVYRHIRSAGFSYTLAPGTYGAASGRDAIDDFWLGRKQGFCEHFATAFVVVMRAMGVPARVVTGYQGADPLLQDGFLIVRQSHAHAWAEYWERGRGWVRADPTAAVAPDRIDRSRNLAARPGMVADALGTVSPELLARVRALWERTNNRWNQWVLNYSRTDQVDLLQYLGVHAPKWQDLVLILAGLLSAAALCGASWALWDRHRQDPWARLHTRMRARLARLRIAAAPHEAPRTLADRVRRELGPVGEALAHELEALDRGRYGAGGRHKPDPAWWRGFARAASGVHPHPPAPRAAAPQGPPALLGATGRKADRQ